ncbi:MAG: NAD(P)/FAD-dependent oxidoreductase [Chloracidobacterium sp.]|uniref:NAD(P)/FAD-dependent oxidoreductase n=1 Tax=Chloracidobacterium validum TaxID=2821543 RepID=A0ABX8B744_9BACT|nr:NAD(P)/FAD-dependent oxidoreductase [Chloracidobacterium validum]QUW02494.1 NAD(P)/FAD-dependent oxidoreductase [Chloracidobacterium validum]
MRLRVAIIGAGPAGSVLSAKLAVAGADVRLYDLHGGAWEKPCGGGVTAKALRQFDFLLDQGERFPRQAIQEIEIVSSGGRSVTFPLDDAPFCIFSRQNLNGLLLERATSAGADFIPRRVTGLRREVHTWRVEAGHDRWNADFVVGADGCTSFVRRTLGRRLPDADQAMCCGYYVPAAGVPRAVVAFPKRFTGYVWAFPRPDHISYGIINQCGEYPLPKLWEELDAFVRWHRQGELPRDRIRYAARVPMLRRSSWKTNRVVGTGWALIGDAAGFVDPITGEGIFYALHSADLLAQALVAEAPGSYEWRWRKAFEADLTEASRRLPKFYRGSMFGASVIDRVLQLSTVHGGVVNIMQQALAGDVDYVTLKGRILRSFVAPSAWRAPKLTARSVGYPQAA